MVKAKFVVDRKKVKACLRFWESNYRVKLKTHVITHVYKLANKSVQNNQQTSAFVHGLLVGYMQNTAMFTRSVKSKLILKDSIVKEKDSVKTDSFKSIIDELRVKLHLREINKILVSKGSDDL